jgi:hypothetical protein
MATSITSATLNVDPDKLYAYGNAFMTSGDAWYPVQDALAGADLPGLAFGGTYVISRTGGTHPPNLWQPGLSAAYNAILAKYTALAADAPNCLDGWATALNGVAYKYQSTDSSNAANMRNTI